MKVQKVKIEALVPYWRNPRDNEQAVAKVAESIRQYGYQAPILVDKKMTIIAGHTRYAALKQLGHEEVHVVITDMDAKKAKEYRIIDNRTSEYASWDPKELTLELKEFTDPLVLDFFFPEIELDTNFDISAPTVTDKQIDATEAKLASHFEDIAASRNGEATVEITCVHCLEKMTVRRSDFLRNGAWIEQEGETDGSENETDAGTAG